MRRADSSGTSRSWVRTTGALAGVLALIMLLAWGYRQVSSSGGKLRGMLRGPQTTLMEVVGRTPLSPRQSLYLVRIGPRLVLLGAAQDAVRALDVIDDPDLVARLLGQAASQRGDSSTAAFRQTLEEQAQGYDEQDDMDETVLPDGGRISSVKEQLAGALKRLRSAAG